mmetsp:Transcript_14933/g.29975  ORF Transcript_14933/g.29975 Transcript_14933/m.29975 type:complete len:261 (-) Transcript_14933:949-1731(-)
MGRRTQESQQSHTSFAVWQPELAGPRLPHQTTTTTTILSRSWLTLRLHVLYYSHNPLLCHFLQTTYWRWRFFSWRWPLLCARFPALAWGRRRLLRRRPRFLCRRPTLLRAGPALGEGTTEAPTTPTTTTTTKVRQRWRQLGWFPGPPSRRPQRPLQCPEERIPAAPWSTWLCLPTPLPPHLQAHRRRRLLRPTRGPRREGPFQTTPPWAGTSTARKTLLRPSTTAARECARRQTPATPPAASAPLLLAAVVRRCAKRQAG